jgi:hypothetical protein
MDFKRDGFPCTSRKHKTQLGLGSTSTFSTTKSRSSCMRCLFSTLLTTGIQPTGSEAGKLKKVSDPALARSGLQSHVSRWIHNFVGWPELGFCAAFEIVLFQLSVWPHEPSWLMTCLQTEFQDHIDAQLLLHMTTKLNCSSNLARTGWPRMPKEAAACRRCLVMSKQACKDCKKVGPVSIFPMISRKRTDKLTLDGPSLMCLDATLTSR